MPNFEQFPVREEFNKNTLNLDRFILDNLQNAEKNNVHPIINFKRQANNEFDKIETLNRRAKMVLPRITPTSVVSLPTLPNPITGTEISRLPGSTTYLEQVFASVGFRPKVYRQLGHVLEAAPQQNASGYILYLVTSGLSVELVTGYRRLHKDVDLVLMHPEVNEHDVFKKTDNVVPHNFWAGMKLDPAFLKRTAFKVGTKEVGEVLCAHPGITLVQKTSDAWGRAPREHDIHDATALGYWMLKQPKIRQRRNLSVANKALLSMRPRQASQTAVRLNTMFANYDNIKRRLGEAVQSSPALLARTAMAHALSLVTQ